MFLAKCKLLTVSSREPGSDAIQTTNEKHGNKDRCTEHQKHLQSRVKEDSRLDGQA